MGSFIWRGGRNMQERSTYAYFRAQHGEKVRKSKAVSEVPYLEKAINACIYKEGVLVGQGTFIGERGEIFEDVQIWNPRKVQNGQA